MVSRVGRRLRAIARSLAAASLAAAVPAALAVEKNAFELELYKSRFEHEIAFRVAAIQVAWGAEPLCDDTTEIEPFVLWSVHATRKPMGASDRELLTKATGMDEQWRIAWLDEAAPDELQLGQVVEAINGRPLPGGASRIDMLAILRGSSPLASDDGGLWDVLLKARDEARDGRPMTVTLGDGRSFEVPTQTGCAGSVVASAFDNEPELFWRQGSKRAKIPGNALLEARSRDEFRWLAAFGTYFQASERAIGRAQAADSASQAFVVGKILTLAVPGAGMLLSAVEHQAERSIVVDGLTGSADLFANEVVAAMGGDPAAGLQLAERLSKQGIKADVLVMTDFRRSNAEAHVQRLREIQAAQDKAAAAPRPTDGAAPERPD